MWFKIILLLSIIWVNFAIVIGIKVTFYQNVNAEGHKIRLNNIEGCTPLPVYWQLRITSLDSHDNCIVVYDKLNCKGRYLLIKASEEDPRVIPDLRELRFNDVIKSVKPCQISPSLPLGRYRIQNLGDGMYMTANNLQLIGWTKVTTKKWKKETSQQWDVDHTPDGNYFLFPRPNFNDEPLPYNVRDLDRRELADIGVFRDSEHWDLLNLHGNVYHIRNGISKKCLVMEGHGQVTQTTCKRAEKNQQWMFHNYNKLD